MDNPERMLIGTMPIAKIVLILPILFMLAYLEDEIVGIRLYGVILEPRSLDVNEDANELINAASNALTNATSETETAMDQAENVLGTAANATANATGELMNRAENVLSLASDPPANATKTAMDTTLKILSNVSSNMSGEIQNTTSNPLQGQFSNHTSSPYQIQFQYPRTWELTEKTSRFDEGSDITISSFSPSAYMTVQYLNSSLLQGSDLQSMLYDFFKSSIEGDYSREYKIIEQPSFTSINDQKAGTYLYTDKDKYEEFATRWATQNWVVRVGDHGYFISFYTSTDLFDSPDMKNIRDQFIKSIKFLGISNQTDSNVPNRFD